MGTVWPLPVTIATGQLRRGRPFLLSSGAFGPRLVGPGALGPTEGSRHDGSTWWRHSPHGQDTQGRRRKGWAQGPSKGTPPVTQDPLGPPLTVPALPAVPRRGPAFRTQPFQTQAAAGAWRQGRPRGQQPAGGASLRWSGGSAAWPSHPPELPLHKCSVHVAEDMGLQGDRDRHQGARLGVLLGPHPTGTLTHCWGAAPPACTSPAPAPPGRLSPASLRRGRGSSGPAPPGRFSATWFSAKGPTRKSARESHSGTRTAQMTSTRNPRFRLHTQQTCVTRTSRHVCRSAREPTLGRAR